MIPLLSASESLFDEGGIVASTTRAALGTRNFQLILWLKKLFCHLVELTHLILGQQPDHGYQLCVTYSILLHVCLMV